jgi:ABC-type antimicrobial peptide transport system permease subunit
VVSAVGLYGVVGYLTALQHREAAIRVALGASPHRLAVVLVGRAMAAVVLGITVGVGLALAGGRAVASQLYGVQPFDPVVLGLAATTLLMTGVLAAYLPARHLRTIEPSTLLRAE